MRPFPFPLLICIAAMPVAMPAEEGVVLHASTSVTQLTQEQLKDVCLGKKIAWDDGSPVKVVVTQPGQSQDLLMGKLGKTYPQFATIWKKLVFSGRASMPEEVANDEAVVAFVSKTPGAIGYVDLTKVKEGVRVIPIR